MKIYTRTGDDGSTGLIGGSRTSKSDPRIDCYGTIDELNAALGLAAASTEMPGGENLLQSLRQIQSDLFVIGSHLAAPENDPAAVKWLPPLREEIVARLEMQIDAANEQLPLLRNFILPGGTLLAAQLHLARTICRRAERLVVTFAQDRPIAAVIITYLNRLSDWLFVHARLTNHTAGLEDIPWIRE
jgi:cob(I)alamin adenosyltransferase